MYDTTQTTENSRPNEKNLENYREPENHTQQHFDVNSNPKGCYEYYPENEPEKIVQIGQFSYRPLCGSVPFFQSIDDVPEDLFTPSQLKMYGYQRGNGVHPVGYLVVRGIDVPLFRISQAKPYRPTRFGVAAKFLEKTFLSYQTRRFHAIYTADGWREVYEYLDFGSFKKHMAGKFSLGTHGGKKTRWFAIDIDCHEKDDHDLFIRRLSAIENIIYRFPEAKFIFSTNHDVIRGAHIIGVFDQTKMTSDLIYDVKMELARIEKETGVPLKDLEVYPNKNHNFRLPLAPKRYYFADEIYLGPDTNRKKDLIEIAKYLQEGEGPLPYYEFKNFVADKLKNEPRPATIPSTKPIAGSRVGKIGNWNKRMFQILMGIETGEFMPPKDSVNEIACVIVRELMITEKKTISETLSFLRDYLNRIPDKSFSDRLMAGNIDDIIRSARWLANNIARGNHRQKDGNRSNKIFSRIRSFCERTGFWFSDRSTWWRYQTSFQYETFEPYQLSFDEKLKVKSITEIFRCSSKEAYKIASSVIGYTIANQGKPLASTSVPAICDLESIEWFTPSDLKNGRCKRAERLLKLLCSTGLIQKQTQGEWHGNGHAQTTASTYTVLSQAHPSALGDYLLSVSLGIPVTKPSDYERGTTIVVGRGGHLFTPLTANNFDDRDQKFDDDDIDLWDFYDDST